MISHDITDFNNNWSFAFLWTNYSADEKKLLFFKKFLIVVAHCNSDASVWDFSTVIGLSFCFAGV